jgi:hypothetical protein
MEPAAVNQRKIERLRAKIADLTSELEVLSEAATVYARLPTRRRGRPPLNGRPTGRGRPRAARSS